MLEITFLNKHLMSLPGKLDGFSLNRIISDHLNFSDFYLIHNGLRIKQCEIINSGNVHVVPRICGGKGGFGSMLRAIGAQIEKTTNREACRDLSGRRLRDINEEKRLKNWIDKQAKREQEIEEKRKQKLERLLHKPKHEFKDETYEKERSELPERLEDAVTQGLQASVEVEPSSSGSAPLKRKHSPVEEAPETKKKKAALWVEDGLEISSGSDISDSEEEQEEIVPSKQ